MSVPEVFPHFLASKNTWKPWQEKVTRDHKPDEREMLRPSLSQENRANWFPWERLCHEVFWGWFCFVFLFLGEGEIPAWTLLFSPYKTRVFLSSLVFLQKEAQTHHWGVCLSSSPSDQLLSESFSEAGEVGITFGFGCSLSEHFVRSLVWCGQAEPIYNTRITPPKTLHQESLKQLAIFSLHL